MELNSKNNGGGCDSGCEFVIVVVCTSHCTVVVGASLRKIGHY